MKSRRLRSLTFITGVLFLPGSVLLGQGLSHVRVVRLSYASGTVAIRRPGSSEWAKGIVNTPIQEGFSVSTSGQSFAEVEFENSSTVRLGELSQIDFSQLALDAQGNKLNHIDFAQGYATYHFMPEHGDAYSVKVADVTLSPEGKTEFRTDFDQGRLRVEVFSGSVEVKTPSQSAKLTKDKVLEYDSHIQTAFDVRRGIEQDDWDKWAQARDTQSQLALNDQAIRPRHSMYGWDDLNTYGEWAYLPGYGYGWSPYAAAGWSPYSMGMWDMYPGMGLTWIGSEPWGWLPYHYGTWNYDASFGWFWMFNGSPFWSPALVSWFAGPGWLGWAPYGYGNSVVAVPGGSIQGGRVINPGNIIHVRPRQGAKIAEPPVAPTERPALATTPSASHGEAVRTSLATSTSRAATTHTAAPATILMGSDPAAERAALGQHPGGLSRFFGGSGRQPLRVQSGATLGGRFPVSGSAAESGGFRGSQRGGAYDSGARVTRGGGSHVASRGSGGGATILSHGGSASARSGGGESGGGGSRGGYSSPSVSMGSSASGGSHSSSGGSSSGHR